jgi:chemotaxis protein methyltransferase CheR
MMTAQELEPLLPRLGEFVASTLGLHFPTERYGDLRRGFLHAAQEFGFGDAYDCARWLLSQAAHPARTQVLAKHLTVGETYFFRDRPVLDALANEILPPLLQARRGRDQRLRLWSAACCTGEEAYTLAILLHRLLPDLQDWQVTVTATDVNAGFLQKATAASYGEWSFRDAPDWLKPGYFQRGADGSYTVIPEIRKMVDFGCLNLVDGAGAWNDLNTGAMDVIFCRNALMYFTGPQMAKVIGRLHDRLVPGGWLAVSPSEASKALFSRFSAVYLPDTILFRRSDGLVCLPPQDLQVAATRAAPAYSPMRTEPEGRPAVQGRPCPAAGKAAGDDPVPGLRSAPDAAPAFNSRAAAEALFRRGAYREAADLLLAAGADHVRDPAALSLLARSLANQGRLADALLWCDRWLAEDKLDAAGHYLRAVVLIEQGEVAQARDSLRRVIYLDGDFVLAHFALGNLARGRGNDTESRTHFANTRRLLCRYQANELLPQSDGLTAGRFAQALQALAGEGTTA